MHACVHVHAHTPYAPLPVAQSSGVPDVPGSASSKVVEVEFAALEDKRLRAQLKDPGFIEAQTTALQISSLKRISKGTKVGGGGGSEGGRGRVGSRRGARMHACMLAGVLCVCAALCAQQDGWDRNGTGPLTHGRRGRHRHGCTGMEGVALCMQ